MAPPRPTPRAHLEPEGRLSQPHPSWPAAFAGLAARLRAALGKVALSIEHVGATAVPGLPAKSISEAPIWPGWYSCC
ncbi:GrpB family protein [Hyalangium gracile]|uniref:GrpB family protein n=1 Tax=Hyalangium gracile TaxID=394092 RepID=UPI001CCBDF26